ncbi:MAG: hypothetical protein SPL12_00030 [Bacteroidales bacterium]|nr:hypothetical protein [Bacteroidales bacterium]
MEVLGESKLLTGLQKYSVGISRKYKSIPKLQVYNNALLTVMNDGMTFEKAYTNPQLWGRWVESAVGCHLSSRVIWQISSDRNVPFLPVPVVCRPPMPSFPADFQSV